MRRVMLTIISSAVAVMPFGGCATGGAHSQEPAQQAEASCPFFSSKMLQGAVIGGAAGGAVAAGTSKNKSTSDILTGIFVGAAAGGLVGKMLDKKDCDNARLAMQQMGGARVGAPIAWRNPESGNSGTFVATSPTAASASGQLCRSYRQTLVLRDGKSKEQEGTTCRDANGDWHPVA